MKHRDDRHVAFAFDLAVDAGDGLAGEAARHRKASQRDHELGLNELDLAIQIRTAGLDLVG